MDFALLNKVIKKKQQPVQEFDVNLFLKRYSKLDTFTNVYLDKDPDTLLETLEEVDSLTTIHSIENNMSLTIMLKEY